MGDGAEDQERRDEGNGADGRKRRCASDEGQAGAEDGALRQQIRELNFIY